MTKEEIDAMKVKDLFETESLLTGRTQIDQGLGANTDDFTIDSNNILNLKNKTSYIAISGMGFTAAAPDTDQIDFTSNGDLQINQTGGTSLVATAQIPNGAVVTGIDAYSDNPDSNNWTFSLKRATHGTQGSSETLGTATGTSSDLSDSSISNGTIDNNTYSYFVLITGLGTNFLMGSVKITYTTDYD